MYISVKYSVLVYKQDQVNIYKLHLKEEETDKDDFCKICICKNNLTV